jgi:hypothetical protein
VAFLTPGKADTESSLMELSSLSRLKVLRPSGSSGYNSLTPSQANP